MSGLRNEVVVGDALTSLQTMQHSSVDMVLTSPPYFRLRDYQVTGQLGLEAHVDQWVDSLHAVARELHRVVVPTGSFWLNLTDSYSAHLDQGAAKKSLLLGPERLALRLVADGWRLRNKIVWAKPNPMPSPVRDRLNTTWEAIYVFVRQTNYYFDLDDIRLPHVSHQPRPARQRSTAVRRESWRGPNGSDAAGLDAMKARGIVGHPLGKNPGDVWTIANHGVPGSHHATFPLALADRAIRAGCPELVCQNCRSPYRRSLIRVVGGAAIRSALGPTCSCGAQAKPGLVLDPFFGAGTTGLAAARLQRDWLGVELNPDFAGLATKRIRDARAGPQCQPA